VPYISYQKTVGGHANKTKNTMKMKRLIILIVFCVYYFPIFSQVGLSTPLYKGKDADLIEFNWAAQIQTFLPILFPIKVKDTAIAYIYFQPAMKWELYNFKKNLIVERQNGFTSFTEDSNISHTYKNRFLKSTSMMQSTSFYMPVNVLIWSKKLKGVLIAPGFYFEYLIGGKFERGYTVNDTRLFIEDKYRDDSDFYGFQRFQYGLCGHISYKFITVYAR